MAQQSDSNKIILKLCCKTKFYQYQVTKTKKFKKTMDMFCQNIRQERKNVSFYYKGRKLDGNDIIEGIVVDNAQIDAFVETFGK